MPAGKRNPACANWRSLPNCTIAVRVSYPAAVRCQPALVGVNLSKMTIANVEGETVTAVFDKIDGVVEMQRK